MTIQITQSAEAKLVDLLTAKNAASEEGIRLTPGGTGGIGMTISPPQEGDEIVYREETPLLIIDPRVATALDGKTIDYREIEVNGQVEPHFTVTD
jgi:Fe-S cluster assembly iron-binding protein IscA